MTLDESVSQWWVSDCDSVCVWLQLFLHAWHDDVSCLSLLGVTAYGPGYGLCHRDICIWYTVCCSLMSTSFEYCPVV